jgi:hypothetical protein
MPDTAPGGAYAIASFKAEKCRALGLPLFVESSAKQAAAIHAAAGVQVIVPAGAVCFGARNDTAPDQGSKAERGLIYTISTGAYSRMDAATYGATAGADFRRITDSDCPAWITSAKARASWAKILGPVTFGRGYAWTLCLDDDMELTGAPETVFAGKAADVICLRRERPDTWSQDLDLVSTSRRAATPEACAAESGRMRAAGMTGAEKCRMTGILYRKTTPAVADLCRRWWAAYSLSETGRDQPALALALFEMDRDGAALAVETVTEPELSAVIVHHARKASQECTRKKVSA